ncbi:TPA: hypothetical protein DEP96_01350 [Candidatus Uhrbacteria bacterium]|nr:hypothetical protein [Candidatus Uhrbacteria bacterium]
MTLTSHQFVAHAHNLADLGIEALHPDATSAVLKFLAILENSTVHIIMADTTQHRALALLHYCSYREEILRTWYARALADPNPHYPREIFRYVYVGAGWISPGIKNLVHVPAQDVIQGWKSPSLQVDTTPEWQALLTPHLLANVAATVEPSLTLSRALRAAPHPDDF